MRQELRLSFEKKLKAWPNQRGSQDTAATAHGVQDSAAPAPPPAVRRWNAEISEEVRQERRAQEGGAAASSSSSSSGSPLTIDKIRQRLLDRNARLAAEHKCCQHDDPEFPDCSVQFEVRKCHMQYGRIVAGGSIGARLKACVRTALAKLKPAAAAVGEEGEGHRLPGEVLDLLLVVFPLYFSPRTQRSPSWVMKQSKALRSRFLTELSATTVRV